MEVEQTLKGQVTGSAAEIYEKFFVPALFQEWAPRVADAAQVSSGEHVLDVACGTGVLARETLDRVGASGRVVGLDRNPGMLAVARTTSPGVDWREGVAEALPFEGSTFDAVVSQFGLMFFDDREAALREMWRVLRPGGRVAVAVWGPLEQAQGYAAVTELLQRLFGDRVANEIRAPFSLGHPDELRKLFDDAGILGAGVRTLIGAAHFPSIQSWVETDVRGWTLAELLDDAQYDELLQAALVDLKRFERPDGSVEFEQPAHIVVARKD